MTVSIDEMREMVLAEQNRRVADENRAAFDAVCFGSDDGASDDTMRISVDPKELASNPMFAVGALLGVNGTVCSIEAIDVRGGVVVVKKTGLVQLRL